MSAAAAGGGEEAEGGGAAAWYLFCASPIIKGMPRSHVWMSSGARFKLFVLTRDGKSLSECGRKLRPSSLAEEEEEEEEEEKEEGLFKADEGGGCWRP